MGLLPGGVEQVRNHNGAKSGLHEEGLTTALRASDAGRVAIVPNSQLIRPAVLACGRLTSETDERS